MPTVYRGPLNCPSDIDGITGGANPVLDLGVPPAHTGPHGYGAGRAAGASGGREIGEHGRAHAKPLLSVCVEHG